MGEQVAARIYNNLQNKLIMYLCIIVWSTILDMRNTITIITQWGCSSVGRAPALQAGGQEFESLHLHLIMSRAAEPAEEGKRCMLACISLDSSGGEDIRRISVSERSSAS